jgi:hypothetical protein
MVSTAQPEQAQLVYPSRVAPTFHPFSLSYPATWQPTPSPSFLAVVVDPSAVAGFHTNIIVGADRVPVETTLAQVAQETLEQSSKSFPDFAVTREEEVVVGGQPAWLRLQSFFADAAGARVAQLLLMFFAPAAAGAETKDYFRIHATCHADAINAYTKPFLDVARSFHFLNPDEL